MARSIPVEYVVASNTNGGYENEAIASIARIFSNIFLRVFFPQVLYLQRRGLTSAFTDVDTIQARA
jgi:hypothetical protein